MKNLLIIVFLFAFNIQIDAQSFYNRKVERQWIGSFGTGTAKYFGDLANPGKLFEGTKWNIEGGIERRIDGRFSTRASLTIFQLKGGDQFADTDGRKARNLSFTTSAFELAITGTVQLFEDGTRYYQRKPFNLFLSAGIGTTWYVPRGLSTNTYHDGSTNPSAGKMVSLRQLQTEGKNYSPVTMVIPIGGGARIMATPFLNITFSAAYRFSFTDYLDDVSTVYPGIDSFEDPLAAAMSDKRFELDGAVADPGHKRGNPTNKDGYFVISVRADYFLPPNIFGAKSRGKAPKRSQYKNGRKRR